MATNTTKTTAGSAVLFRHDKSGTVQREFLALLTEGYRISVVGPLRGGLVVEREGSWWQVADNGGELNVQRINDSASLVSIASTAHGASVDGETMAYRVAMVLRGEKFDYGLRVKDNDVANTVGPFAVEASR